MSSPIIPTGDQLAQARLSQWHQNGEALLTFENLRSWMNVAGLVLFTPRAQQLPSPAPSFVEAVLGAPTPEPTLADTEQARSLLARLIAEGIAVPLNLLGTPGETPDFIASAAVFSYIFTLRGDKAWKQPPATSGAVKVSPLAAAAHEVLTRRPVLSAYDLTTELGKEVTESAVLRALNELWAHLRVLPIGQPDGQATLWELAGSRFTKQIKAGANAGQPSALSALISLYLGNALLASEEEIETFLSPLASRSRIRDVVHALMGARELETIAVEGRTVLHVSGALPAFIAPVAAEGETGEGAGEEVEAGAETTLEATDAPRISKFVAKPRKVGTGFPSDYGRKFNGTPLEPREERDRRPFKRDGDTPGFKKPGFSKPGFAARGPRPDRSFEAKPRFNKPWEEDRAARPAAAAGEGAPAGEPGFKPRSDRGDGTRPAYSRKPAFGARPSFGGDKREGFKPRPNFGEKREGFAPRPGFRRDDDSRPPRRGFTPRTDGDSSAPRKTFSKPGTFGRKREGGFAGKPSFGSDSRPPRPGGGGFAPRTPGSYSARPQGGSFDRGDRAPRGDRPDRGGFAPRKPFTPRGDGPPRSGGFTRDRDASAGDRPRPAFRKFDAPRGDRPQRPYSARPEGGSDGTARPYSKPAGGGFGPKKPFSKPGGKPSGFDGKPASTFTKFANGKNPFRKPGKPGGKGGSYKGKPQSGGSYDKAPYRKRKSEGE